jgi:hypothetical protein
MERGVPVNLAHQVAQELEGKDALQAHAREELSIDIDVSGGWWLSVMAGWGAAQAG